MQPINSSVIKRKRVIRKIMVAAALLIAEGIGLHGLHDALQPAAAGVPLEVLVRVHRHDGLRPSAWL